MPFNALGRKQVPLTTFGGLSTIADQYSLPLGSSPRCQNMDFNIGSVFSRSGLTSEFVYNNGIVTNTAGLGANSTPPNLPWSNPTAVEGPSSTNFASVNLGQAVQAVSWVPSNVSDLTGTDTPWTNPSFAISTGGNYATNAVPQPPNFSDVLVASGNAASIPFGATITGVEVSFNAAGSGVLLPFNLLGGPGLSPSSQSVSLTSSVTSYTLGSPTYLWGYSSLNTFQVALLDAQFQAHRISAGTTVQINSLRITVFYQYPNGFVSDQLQATEFDFDVANSSQIVSLSASLTGYASNTGTLTAQLTNQGALIGTPQTVTLPIASPNKLTFDASLWGVILTPLVINSTSFGIAITAESAGTVYVNNVVITANVSTSSVNFTYLKTGHFQLGNTAVNTQTLAFDTSGSLWCDPDFTGTLSLLKQNLANSCFAKSVTQNDREYLCISDLTTGTDIPYQYVPYANPSQSYLDRVSQVGPGAPPVFTTSQSGSNSNVAPITAWSITSNVVTFTAVNNFTAGEVVQISGLTAGSFLNGASSQVMSTGLSTSQFEVSFEHANASATEAGTATPQYSFGISSITQNAAQTAGFACVLWSSGPGATTAGNVVTFYYRDAVQNPTGDTVLINAYNSGQNPYVFISGSPLGNGTQQVTSVGIGKAPGGQDNQYYFTIQANSASYQKIGVSSHVNGNYQMTVGTITTASAVPDLTTGDQVILSNVSPAAWDGTYTITAVVNGSTMTITATSVDSTGTATFNWALTGTSTQAPVAGSYVDITGTLNATGQLNGPGQLISSVTGTTTGQFTITGYTVGVQALTPELSGQALSYGTQFSIDPGPSTLNTTTSPIYGNATSGQLVIIGGSSTVIGAGTRQGTVFFQTRNGFTTAPAPPVTFTTPSNTNYIFASNIPIGPPDVIARWICFTEAGQNNVAGGSFYTIPTPVDYTVNGITYVSSSLVINDNTTTSAKFTFTDQVLLSATEIDIQGANQFNEIEIGNPAWNVSYANRMFYGLCNTKIQNFNNLSFDGGYLANPGGNLLPLGWSVQADPTTGVPASITSFSISGGVVTFVSNNSFAAGQTVYITGLTTGTYLNNLQYTVLAAGLSASQFEVNTSASSISSTPDSGLATPLNIGSTLQNSTVFGTSYLIQNTTGAPQLSLGMIYQSAYQDAYNQNILLPNTLYSVRVTCRTNTMIGGLTIDLTDLVQGHTGGAQTATFGTTYASFGLPCNEMTSSFKTYTGSLVFNGNLQDTGFGGLTPVPSTLQLRVFAGSLGTQGDIEIDRIEIFPTQTPIDKTTVYASYVDNPEAFDSRTGQLQVNATNTQPVNGALELFDSLYLLKSSSMFVTDDSSGSEPSKWDIRTVSNTVGAIGPNSFDSGEQWMITACRQGVFLFVGKQPMKINHEIIQVWNAINWQAGKTIWLKNDITNRKLYIGVPLPTGPNSASASWLPNAATNATPTSPNVVLMCSYEGLESAEDLATGQQLRETMFSTLVAPDARRKWSIWTIPSPYADFITQENLNAPLMFGSGTSSSQILGLDDNATSDAGIAIDAIYTTAGFVDPNAGQQNGTGTLRKLWSYFTTLIRGTGNCTVTMFPNTLSATYPNVLPGGINLQTDPQNDLERPLNVQGTRVFVQFETNAIGSEFNLSSVVMVGQDNKMTPVRGLSQ